MNAELKEIKSAIGEVPKAQKQDKAQQACADMCATTEDEENEKRITGAKEFARTLRGMMALVVDLEERMIRLERLHHELGGKRIIKG